jgi:hypothetical protein
MPQENSVEILIAARDQASAVLQNVVGELGGLGSAISQLGTAGGILGAVAAGVVAVGAAAVVLGKRLSDDVEQLGRMSVQTGATIEQLQVARQIIEESGGNVSNLTTSLIYLNQRIGEGHPLLKKLGLEGKDAFSAFMALSQMFVRSSDTASQARIAQQLLGGRLRDLRAEMGAIAKQFPEMDASMRASGQLITEDMVPAAMKLDSELDKMQRDWKAAWVNMEKAALPAATKIVGALAWIIDKMREAAVEKARWERMGMGAPTVSGMTVTPGAGGMLPAHGWGAGPDLAGALAKEGKPHQMSLADQLRFALGGVGQGWAGGKGATRGFVPGKAIKVSDLIEVPPASFDPFRIVVDRWSDAVGEITSTAGELDIMLGGLWNGLQAGFQTVFAYLTNASQTFGSAMRTIFKSLVDGILAELGRILAAKVFQLLLKIVGIAIGVPVPTVGGGGGGGGVPSPIPGGALSMSPARPGLEGGNTYVIQTLDARDAIMSLRSSSGGMRRANEILSFQGAM